MTRFTYYAPLDPECPDVRAFLASGSAGEDGQCLRGVDVPEELARLHRAECERCHVYGAVHLQVRES